MGHDKGWWLGTGRGLRRLTAYGMIKDCLRRAQSVGGGWHTQYIHRVGRGGEGSGECRRSPAQSAHLSVSAAAAAPCAGRLARSASGHGWQRAAAAAERCRLALAALGGRWSWQAAAAGVDRPLLGGADRCLCGPARPETRTNGGRVRHRRAAAGH